MNTASDPGACTRRCWTYAAIAGVVLFLILLLVSGFGFWGALFWGVVACVAGGFLLTRTLCGEVPSDLGRAIPPAAPVGDTPKAARQDPSDPAPVMQDAPPDATDGPSRLKAPRGGVADDLKMIKGVGPKLESVLHEMGFFHFDQIAGWSEEDVAWADQNLVGFKGRVSRDNWVEQARALASGAETEFAKRAKKDGRYNQAR